ncbi:MAG: hypothetical protein KDB61_11505, partial [Planctomycetes bacterium]|nr:hypothetical protein [Planctomycetota bacterium]
FKLLDALQQAGWKPDDDPTYRILLGGKVGLKKGHVSAFLLIEPRFTQTKELFGIQSRVYESTPDLVLSQVSGKRPVVFVLDPTLQTGAGERQKKAKYLSTLCLVNPQKRFGVSLLMGPQCAWAASPITGSVCIIDDPTRNGATGTIPMNPLEFNPAPLGHWVEEFESIVNGLGLPAH